MNEFNLSKSIDTSKSITLNYIPIGLKNILLNTGTNEDKNITAECEPSSSSHVTFTDNNIKSEFKATRVCIVGTANDTKVNQISGVASNGQLIIKNVDTDNNEVLFMCFPLVVANPGPSNSGIDALIRTAGSSTTTLTVNFNADIFAKEISEVKYVEYSSSLGGNERVVTFAHPISIISTDLMALENNTTFFNLQPSEYSILTPSTPGEWMECDYVPIDSEEVETYNLPVSSSLVQDSAAHNSLKTMFMYILFLLFTGMSYSVIPAIYKYILSFLFNILETTGSARKIFMDRFDTIMRVSLLILIIIFFAIGNQFILYGIVISIVTLLGYIIISSKKSNDKKDDVWPINEIEKDELD
jgi:hypothetical protein